MILPEPTHVPLRGGPVVRWGILAPGGIADAWTETLHRNTDQRVAAVASRTLARAEEFAARHGVGRSFGSYDELVADPGVDVVYIAAPHSEHRRLALLAIGAGKHVLVEKPIGLSAAEAREIAVAARAAGVFAMEAMWSRFLPQTTVLARLLEDGALGDVLTVTADFGAVFDTDPQGRAYNPALGGGALLDVGIYPVWFAHLVLGTPSAVTARGSLTATGVDAQAAVILDYGTPAQAVLTTSMLVSTPRRAAVSGTLAEVRLPRDFMGPGELHLVRDDEVLASMDDPNGFRWRDGLCYEAVAVATYIAEGRTESPLHSLDDTVAIMTVLDEARRQVGAA
ncbi:Gfo/Idh/MocA family protein [Salinibacterium soli]|uniref:Gfo/Idh/MocA family oxidoreductase n=1 Tax=Antiquaquibacter soli TaxID=3064523 RepID=A0ABT9BHZ1_9MICO|nr:Gfo/Idh/MocA family oxidoreductase [Protaetiibacter sp. WY-16]MDO7880638.1 Gfo/Idh/MocA family oxidoreductase [Protaetiibacter sp. WY-16]